MSTVNFIALIGVLTGILLAVGWLLGGFVGMFLALILSFALNLLSYWYSDRIVLGMYKAEPLNSPKIDDMIDKLALDAKIPKPKMYIVNTDVPNAFATGRDPRHSAIAITKGILKLSDEELEGVLAHEVSHIMNRDVLIGAMAATIAGAIAYLAHIGYWSMFFGDRDSEGSALGMILIVIFAPLAALLIRMAISRMREFKADHTGALLTKNPKGLASALYKIENVAVRHPVKGSSATAHMWITNPFKRDWFSNLFATHPSMQDRIARLQQMEVNKKFEFEKEQKK